MYDRADYRVIVEKQHGERELLLQPLYQTIRGASLILAKIKTESDAWNRYLEILQGCVNQIKETKMAAVQDLADNSIWDPIQLTRLKSDIIKYDAQVEALNGAMELPKAIMDGGETAKEKINEFEKNYGQHTDTQAA